MSLQATRVLAIRHGETAWNVDTRIQGQLDIGLNPTGRRQAERLARALAQEPLAAVYSSDLSRAVLDAGLRERAFGRFEGRTFDEIAQAWPDDSLRWRRRDPSFGPAGGETLSAFYDRCVATAERLAAAHPGEAIALVAHGGVLDCLYRAATRLDLQAPRTWLVANAGINRLLYTGEGFTLVGWADLGHLQDLSLDEFADGGAAADRAGPAA
ncbi:histidine phosphatase family protein [Piscinibacter sakaiensis]|uniref:histidine phosphatase family protein n=1 Tax=Piscinibacter sakaiensis TaxID=1547922 RepID=UPI00372834CB